jgi:flavin-dependent dehydrogenase
LFRNDEFEYDVLIIGGAFSGAATALMLKRKRPDVYAENNATRAPAVRSVGNKPMTKHECRMTKKRKIRTAKK